MKWVFLCRRPSMYDHNMKTISVTPEDRRARKLGELQLLPLQACADTTGESRAVWKQRVRRGEVTVVYCGRNVRVPVAELRAWIEKRTFTKTKGL
jgi:hypothetical protein